MVSYAGCVRLCSEDIEVQVGNLTIGNFVRRLEHQWYCDQEDRRVECEFWTPPACARAHFRLAGNLERGKAIVQGSLCRVEGQWLVSRLSGPSRTRESSVKGVQGEKTLDIE